MFDRLKKRLSEAIKGFAKSEEEADRTIVEPAAVQAGEIVSEAQDSAPQKQQEAAKNTEEGKSFQEDIKISIGTKLKGSVLKKVSLNQKEIDDFIENLKVLLLESDVSFEASEAICERIRTRLAESRIDSSGLRNMMVQIVRDSLEDVLNSSYTKIDLVGLVSEKKKSGSGPAKLLFLGPNGTGKTTTMAKISKMLSSAGISSAFSASDTFRAAAIEQSEYHAKKVGVPIIKSSYGADPASVAFDAIKYATAHSIDAVLIDTAGRQETNKNLIKEMEKMYRVAKPDMAIYVAESTGGNAVIRQISEFSKEMKIDGIILTKLDCDAKGGNAISIANSAGLPILFLGTGESYDDIVPYTPKFIVDRILPAA